jgi:hypothetical protein
MEKINKWNENPPCQKKMETKICFLFLLLQPKNGKIYTLIKKKEKKTYKQWQRKKTSDQKINLPKTSNWKRNYTKIFFHNCKKGGRGDIPIWKGTKKH